MNVQRVSVWVALITLLFGHAIVSQQPPPDKKNHQLAIGLGCVLTVGGALLGVLGVLGVWNKDYMISASLTMGVPGACMLGTGACVFYPEYRRWKSQMHIYPQQQPNSEDV